MPRTFVSQTALVFDEGELEEVPDVEADRSAHEILGWELEPGDAVAFHMLTLHQAGGSPTLRRAFSVRLLGDDARYAPRPHPTSPPFPGLDARARRRRPVRRAAVPAPAPGGARRGERPARGARAHAAPSSAAGAGRRRRRCGC